jgi:hypothetical protein
MLRWSSISKSFFRLLTTFSIRIFQAVIGASRTVKWKPIEYDESLPMKVRSIWNEITKFVVPKTHRCHPSLFQRISRTMVLPGYCVESIERGTLMIVDLCRITQTYSVRQQVIKLFSWSVRTIKLLFRLSGNASSLVIHVFSQNFFYEFTYWKLVISSSCFLLLQNFAFETVPNRPRCRNDCCLSSR